MSENYLEGRLEIMATCAEKGQVPFVETLVLLVYHELDELGLDASEYEARMRNLLIKAYDKKQESRREPQRKFAKAIDTLEKWEYGLKTLELKDGETPYNVMSWNWKTRLNKTIA